LPHRERRVQAEPPRAPAGERFVARAKVILSGRTPTVVGADVFAREQQIATMLATMIGR
jgi:acyl-coenzyme A thioesterase PaaI-like protein